MYASLTGKKLKGEQGREQKRKETPLYNISEILKFKANSENVDLIACLKSGHNIIIHNTDSWNIL